MKDFTSARDQLRKKIQAVTVDTFEPLALEVFRFQARYNDLYASFLKLLRLTPDSVDSVASIPCLPISFFKSHRIQTGDWMEATTFTSSGTTDMTTSRHFVRDLDWYLENARRGFTHFYGDLSQYLLLALLPSYLERSGSSLVVMADDFIRRTGHPRSGFFLYNTQELLRIVVDCQKRQIRVLLLGVSFALLDLAEEAPVDLSGITVMETGGMKGRRRELTREELHRILMSAFSIEAVHSEYGMTELFSQAYSKGGGRFQPAPTLRARARDITDPFAVQTSGRTGALDLIDLANLDTLAFIASDDLGKVYDDYSFEVLGRMDASDIRGCNLLVS